MQQPTLASLWGKGVTKGESPKRTPKKPEEKAPQKNKKNDDPEENLMAVEGEVIEGKRRLRKKGASSSVQQIEITKAALEGDDELAIELDSEEPQSTSAPAKKKLAANSPKIVPKKFKSDPDDHPEDSVEEEENCDEEQFNRKKPHSKNEKKVTCASADFFAPKQKKESDSLNSPAIQKPKTNNSSFKSTNDTNNDVYNNTNNNNNKNNNNNNKEDRSESEASKVPFALSKGEIGGQMTKRGTRFHPVHDACWKLGEAVPYLALAKTFEDIESNAGRLRMIESLTNLFRSVIALTPKDLTCCVFLAVNKLAPEFEGVELGIGTSILIKAISEATGRAVSSIKGSLDELGDLGAVAQASKLNQRMMVKPARLTLQSVFKKLKEIAEMRGNSSQNKKKDLIKSLLVAGTECEPLYIIRALEGKMRIGLAEKSVLAALSRAIVLTPPDLSAAPPPVLDMTSVISSHDLEARFNRANEVLRSVFSELPNYSAIVAELLSTGGDLAKLQEACHLTPGIPVKPMLAQPTKGIQEVLDRFTNTIFTCEFKYDGERAQIHYVKDKVFSIYSRNMENNTGKYPDILQRLPNSLTEGVESFILDCEVVAWDIQAKKILPFQVLSTRARKSVAIEDIKVQVCLFAFDLLFLNGKSLVKQPFQERRELLHKSFKDTPGELAFAKSIDTNDIEEIQTFLEDAVEGNCEGLMVKMLREKATYQPSNRSWSWLKVKKDYIQGMGDSLDLIVMGAYLGRGKRTGVYGGYLLGCYNDETEEIQSICKIGTGFSDDFLQSSTKFFKQHIIPGPKAYYAFAEQLACTVWFEPVQVWEVLAADLSISPLHKAAEGAVDPNKGIALRFPRFVRIRDDKKVEMATSSTQVADMYRSQKINHVSVVQDEEDDY